MAFSLRRDRLFLENMMLKMRRKLVIISIFKFIKINKDKIG